MTDLEKMKQALARYGAHVEQRETHYRCCGEPEYHLYLLPATAPENAGRLIMRIDFDTSGDFSAVDVVAVDDPDRNVVEPDENVNEQLHATLEEGQARVDQAHVGNLDVFDVLVDVNESDEIAAALEGGIWQRGPAQDQHENNAV